MTTFIDDIEVVQQTVSVDGPMSSQLVTVNAPTGKKVLSGGFYDPSDNVGVRYSYPSADGLS